MNTGRRAFSTVIVYLTAAIIAEVIVEVALILTTGGQFPSGLWLVFILLGPFVGFVVASRYWSESEFVRGRTVPTPLLFIVLLVVVLAASSLFMARPVSTIGLAPPTSLPQASPSALPALPPAPTHDLRPSSSDTRVGNA